ncbi:MAG: Ku protein [Planctomycetes bacterium]|nr:Ku protein [Planctomycetota bacterium]MBI3844820.1 Ku protein [Planctomycetota bacterium]
MPISLGRAVLLRVRCPTQFEGSNDRELETSGPNRPLVSHSADARYARCVSRDFGHRVVAGAGAHAMKRGVDRDLQRGLAVERPIWKGTLSFGLLEIPVVLQSAEKATDLKFTFLDSRDLAPVGYKKFNKKTGEEVPWKAVVRGYEYEKGKYVVLSDADLKRANVEATQTIDVVEFVDANSIDPLFYERPYFVVPVDKESRGYALLREALHRTNRVGIAKLVLRERQHVAALLVRDSILVVVLMRFAQEIRDPVEIPAPRRDKRSPAVREKEMELAEQLIQGMSAKWRPEQFRDEYRHDLLALIDRKIRSGRTAVIEEPEVEEKVRGNDVADLVRLLKSSVAATRTRSSAHALSARTRTKTRHHVAKE